MEIKKAELKNKKDIQEIVNLLHIDIADFVWNKDEFIEKQINNGEYFLAYELEKPVGVISFKQRQNKMYIETIAVVKDFQSKGIGTQLIKFAKEYTKKNNLNTLMAYAFYQYNTSGFYLKNGFSLLKKPGKYNGNKYHRFEMSVDSLLN